MSESPAQVLIAEDEPLASMALRAQVEALGHTVTTARNGIEAAALARCLPFELGIFDMKMPGMTGLEAATDVFADAPTPVLLLTGFATSDLPDPVPEPPIFSLLTKPIGMDDLRKGMRRARERFQAWSRREGKEEEILRERGRREIIAAALSQLDEGGTADAAIRFLQRARDENATPAELAIRVRGDRSGG